MEGEEEWGGGGVEGEEEWREGGEEGQCDGGDSRDEKLTPG